MTMRNDPIIEEVHRTRREHAKRCNYDLATMFEDVRKREAKRSNLVDLRPLDPALPCVAEEHATCGVAERKVRRSASTR